MPVSLPQPYKSASSTTAAEPYERVLGVLPEPTSARLPPNSRPPESHVERRQASSACARSHPHGHTTELELEPYASLDMAREARRWVGTPPICSLSGG